MLFFIGAASSGPAEPRLDQAAERDKVYREGKNRELELKFQAIRIAEAAGIARAKNLKERLG